MKKVILLNGLPRSGKDTCADYLVEQHGYTKFSFASTMKEIVANTFNITVEQVEAYKNNPDNFILELSDESYQMHLHQTNFREILQRFGNEAMKPIFGDDVWAKTLYDKIDSCKNDKIVVSDFRFLIEYRPNNDFYLDLETWLIHDGRKLPTEGHASDVELYQNNFIFDNVINNTERDMTKYKREINIALGFPC